MNFLIVTHVVHKRIGDQIFGYGPYIKEMNIWIKNVAQVTIVAPLDQTMCLDAIDLPYIHSNIDFVEVPEFNLLTWKARIKSFTDIPFILYRLSMAMAAADHIHLRCPGNMGLLGSMVQMLFPFKQKSAKYAGNWDWNSQQPFTYRIQQKLLRNQWLTRNIKTLVYGNWENNNENILPFFTATYSAREIIHTPPRSFKKGEVIRLLFVGTLSKSKNPLLSVSTCHYLNKKKINAIIQIYGEGPERETIEEYVRIHDLDRQVQLHGNVPAAQIKEAYQNSHFLIFISQSEGWPKVVAESMFWGCLPLTSDVSCVSDMIGHGERGDLVESDVDRIVDLIHFYIGHPQQYTQKCLAATNWSRMYTLEKFENEISKLMLV